MTEQYDNIAGNYYDKFHASNPIVRWMMHGFKSSLLELLSDVTYDNLLEIGCGEGHIQTLLTPNKAVAMDIDFPIVKDAMQRYSPSLYAVADGTAMPLPDKHFDMVLGIEVMEHVPHPERFIQEAVRLSRRYCLFSVPREPLWRALNMARGRYLSDWGNTPGHIQHWSSSTFATFLSQYVRVIAIKQPIPWTMVLCEVE